MIEYNPHIIKKLHSTIAWFEKRILRDDDYFKRIKKNTDSLKNGFEQAKKALKEYSAEDLPLAYRLSPQISDITDLKNDTLEAPKFGGIPDFTRWYEFMYFNSEEKRKDLHKTIEETWPRCGCCHKPLLFLSQFDISDWAASIHLLTYHDTRDGDRERDEEMDYHQQLSALGNGSTNKVDSTIQAHQLWYYIFYCDCWCWENPSSNSVVLIKNIYIPSGDLRDPSLLPKEQCLWSVEDYLKAMQDFMLLNNIHPESRRDDNRASPIPLQFIKNFELYFDVDIGDGMPDKLYNDIWEAKENLSVFKRQGNYHLFGEPISQQSVPRYLCRFGYNSGWGSYKLHRQAPIINWDDHEHDMTYQMYGCFRCKDSQSDTVWSKVDATCT